MAPRLLGDPSLAGGCMAALTLQLHPQSCRLLLAGVETCRGWDPVGPPPPRAPCPDPPPPTPRATNKSVRGRPPVSRSLPQHSPPHLPAAAGGGARWRDKSSSPLSSAPPLPSPFAIAILSHQSVPSLQPDQSPSFPPRLPSNQSPSFPLPSHQSAAPEQSRWDPLFPPPGTDSRGGAPLGLGALGGLHPLAPRRELGAAARGGGVLALRMLLRPRGGPRAPRWAPARQGLPPAARPRAQPVSTRFSHRHFFLNRLK